MGKSLVIVESTTKTKTISKFLGKNYEILSSVGHIKDLPKQRLGVDLDDGFEPEYITIRGKGKILSKLRKSAAVAERIFLATDPDREGEAIAHHLAEEVKSKNQNVYRVLFNEITEKAVRSALDKPTQIDDNKVAAQKARRVVDRLVGYQVSPLLWRTVYRGLSAGRVQSVALRLLCEREVEVENFVAEEYWSVTAKLCKKESDPFLSKLTQIDKQPPKLPDEKTTNGVLKEIGTQSFKVASVKKKTVTRNPAPPFTTSTMQQAAANRLGYSSKKIMMIAQQLYEGVELGDQGSVGLITYMRTDSTRVANEALDELRQYILTNYGKEYLPASPRKYKVKRSAQDAHEAIRPTSSKLEPKKIKRYLTSEQFRLYSLIWNRFVASQMQPAKYEQTTIDIDAGERFLFRTSGSIVTFRGFLLVYEDFKEDASKNGDEKTAVPKDLQVGDDLNLLDLMPKQHFTKPPPRYSESSLIKELDALGIGRPSTYAMIISTVVARKYVEKNQRQLIPTELGRTVNTILIQNFPELFNVEFTAKMENNLDEIETGRKRFLDVTRDFYLPFKQSLTEAESKQREIKDALQEGTQETCPQCGKELIIRWGRNGKFMACTGYPDCKYTKPLEEPETVEETCDKCGRPMVIKHGRFGRFLACSGYPECKNTQPISLGVACPKEDCDGSIVEKRSRKGRTFFGCSNYPKCNFATWYRPVNVPCTTCQNPYVEKRMTQAKGEYYYCPACKAEISPEDKDSYREIAYG